MPDLGVPELLIVAVIVLLLFGPGKASDIGSALGKSIREFRKASTEEDEAPAPSRASSAPSSTDVVAPPADVTVVQSPTATAATASTEMQTQASRFCTECGSGLAESQKFCTACGAAALTPTR